MEVLEVKRTLDGAAHTFRCLAADVTPRWAVLLYTIAHPRRIADLDLPAGTVTVAYYWVDRPYNVYHWVAPSGETLAWYFNTSGPVRIGEGRVEWDDLAVDVLVTPDLRAQVLDEDELPAGLAPGRRAEIAAVRDRILREYPRVVEDTRAASRDLLARAPGIR